MNWANRLTVARLVMAGGFFVLLELASPAGGDLNELRVALPLPGDAAAQRALLFNAALGLFVLASLTDVLDGWVARRFAMTSDFGRIADPFADKVIVCGGFIFLATLPADLANGRPFVPAWIAVLIIAREFLVTGLRGFIEARGQAFGAQQAGKLKMLVQCVTIGGSLFVMANLSATPWAHALARGCVWVCLVVTLASGVSYLAAARRLLAGERATGDP